MSYLVYSSLAIFNIFSAKIWRAEETPDDGCTVDDPNVTIGMVDHPLVMGCKYIIYVYPIILI